MSAMADRRDILMFTADRAGVSAIRATLNEEGHRGKQPVMDRCCTGTCERGTGSQSSASRRMEQSASTLADGRFAAGMDEMEQRADAQGHR
jgi:hypothetical protein